MRYRIALPLLLAPSLALADRPEGVCVQLQVEFTPTDNLQIVGWLEKPDGTFVDTVYITDKTGRYGMGNRPGRPDFNTNAPAHDGFPYGRREQTFPVWAHRHGKTFPKVVAQDDDENTLSHELKQSSPELFPYTRPILPGETGAPTYTCVFDTSTCASPAFTDKGKFDPNGGTSLYPPRADLTRNPAIDTSSVDLYRANNPFDAVTHATPVGGMPATALWAAPQSVDFGSYVLFVEASKTYDFNATYNETTYPAPLVSYGAYGKPWRGQPSVVYSVPISIAATPAKAIGDTYIGYGDPDGESGELRAPDSTITTDTPGSGASRFQLVSDGADMFRVRVRTTPEFDAVPPSDLGAIETVAVSSSTATLAFAAPGDDGTIGNVAGYEVRIRADVPITEDNFAESVRANVTVSPEASGARQLLDVTNLLPETKYYVGIRPVDNCFNRGALSTIEITTGDRTAPEIPWCFIATAAYGSSMATEVGMLRRFRDGVLEQTVFGELAVETYYTFGPALAGAIDPSELLRATARGFLAPIVATVGRFAY